MRKEVCIFEIFILVMAGVSFSYFVSESPGIIGGEDKTITFLREKILNYLSNGIVSAEGLWTCLEDLNGSACQEYPSGICDDRCADDCIPARRQDTSECKTGTCYDSLEGTCAANSPKILCENTGGLWYEQEPAICKPGCCVLGGNTNYISQQACNVLQDRLGIFGEWKNVDNEIQCLLMGNQQEEGACVLEEVEPGLKNCKFTTKADCLSKGGEFSKGLLCTNPSLGTVCQRTKETSCIDGKEGVYFLDSCGNRANIYDTKKKANDDYWSRIYSKNESCELNGYQEGCGNCDYLLGNICGTPGNDDEKPLEGNYVCRDLSCVDEYGEERKNGESWCTFDSKIGIDNLDGKNKERSSDVPGSRHYRQVCADGEIRTEPCQDFRNEVCQEDRDEKIGFSSASCRLNGWQTCIAANQDKRKLENCEENSACFLKEVRLDDFKFDVCAPKYPAGFDLKAQYGGETGETICSLASQVCTVVEVKKFSGWSCEANCECLEKEFTETMNNLCISLGDCGGHVNLQGEFTDSGYSVKKAPRLKENYISGLRDYINPDKNQRVDPLTNEEIAAMFNLDPDDPQFNEKAAEILAGIGIGAAGVLVAIDILIWGPTFFYSTAASGAFSTAPGAWGATLGNLGAWANQLGAAAAGAAIGFVLGKLFGLQGEALTAVTVLGAFTGLVVHTGFFGFFEGAGLFSGTWFIWTIIIIIIIILIFKFIGIGDTRITKVAFTCMPWQPPLGGDACQTCADGDLPCSKYKCQSLGQTCEFVNEGTSQEACIDIAPDDVLPPKISPNYDAINDPFEYKEVTDRGFRVISPDECIPAYTQVNFGVSLDEFGQCKYDTERVDYDTMEFYFGESSLFKKNHVTAISLPSLDSLGETGIDPNRRADFDLYVKCQDGSGNVNANDYTIRFCVSPEDDITPPILQNFQPKSPAYVSLDSENLNLTFYTNEPAECRYSLTDEDYEQMDSQISCKNDISEFTLFGFECNSLLPVSDAIYLRCKDRPWAEDRNANKQSIVYEIIKTSEPLKIDSIDLEPSPIEGVISVGNEPVTVDVIIKTSGGAPVNTYCTYGFGGRNDLATFFETGADIHKQRFNSLFKGDYELGIRCEDDAGNVANDLISFEISVDDEGPLITRIYSKGDLLNVITNENSLCYYSHNSCSFAFEEGFEMSGNEKTHIAEFNSKLNYYIKCEDSWGNTGSCVNVRAGY